METKEQRKKRNHEYYLAHKKELLKKHKEWQENNLELCSKYNQNWHWNLKKKVLTAYGGVKCMWPGCEETRLSHLQLDHINNDGGSHRRTLFGNNANNHNSKYLSAHFYRYLKRQGFPNDPPLQVLCRNHNQEKETNYMKEQEIINGPNVWQGYEGVLNKPARAFGLTREDREEW